MIWFFAFLSVAFHCSGRVPSPKSEPYHLDTLIFLDEVLLEIWDGGETRENAMSRLRYTCRNQDTDDGFICYSLGLVEYKRGNFLESYTAFQKALEKNPNDTLYKNMLRLSAEKSNNLEDLKAKGEEATVLATYSSLIEACQTETKREFLFPRFLELAKLGHLTKDMLRRGVVSSCFSLLNEEEKSQISAFAKHNPIRYADRLADDRTKADPWSKVWDTRAYHKGEEADENPSNSKPLTEHWKKVKSAAKTGDVEQARIHLKSFTYEIQQAKKKGGLEANLALALERAAKLLIEQDPSFARISVLAKEL
ncbi:tetratricopeptide repeat protein [Leptospira ryugenii]|nr:tetratricopeptide repeat protein [Leptospira ryugenii]